MNIHNPRIPDLNKHRYLRDGIGAIAPGAKFRIDLGSQSSFFPTVPKEEDRRVYVPLKAVIQWKDTEGTKLLESEATLDLHQCEVMYMYE